MNTELKNVYKAVTPIAGFTVGTALTTLTDVAAYYRALWELGTDPPAKCPLTDTEIFAICEAIASTDDGEADDLARVNAMEQGVKVKPTLAKPNENLRAQALDMAKQAPASLSALLMKGIDARETEMVMIVSIASLIDPLLPRNANGKLTCPIPGSEHLTKIKDVNGIEHEYKLEVYDRYSGRQNGQRVTGGFYSAFVEQLPEGKAVTATLRQIDKAKGMDVADVSSSVEHADGMVTTVEYFSKMSPKGRDVAASRWKGRLTYMTRRVSLAAKFVMRLEETLAMNKVRVCLAAEDAPGAEPFVIAGMELTPKGRKPQTSNIPVQLYDPADFTSLTNGLAVSTFMNYVVKGGVNDPFKIEPKAVDDNATITELAKTIERETKTPTTTGDVAAIPAGNLTQWDKFLAETAAWISDPGNYTMFRTAKHSDDTMLSIAKLADIFGAYYDSHKERIDAIEARINAEEEAEAAERAARLLKTG